MKATRASKAAAGTKSRATAKRSAGNGTEVRSAHQRANRIAVAAYYLAEQRGFAPNHELDDWLAAERSL